jgi:hypothetical protein
MESFLIDTDIVRFPPVDTRLLNLPIDPPSTAA